jgi:hypothetical protein
MSWLKAAMVALRSGLVGAVAYLAVSQFMESAAAATVRDLWQQYLGSLPLGPVADYVVVHAPLVISLGLLAAPLASALFGQGPRAIVWLVIVAFVLMAPGVLATSWIDWFRFLGEGAERTFESSAGRSGPPLLASLAVAAALYLLWQTDRLQSDVARFRLLGFSDHDVSRHAAAQGTTTLGIGAAALATTLVMGLIARAVMGVADGLDAHSWASVGAVAFGLVAVTLTIAVVAMGLSTRRT